MIALGVNVDHIATLRQARRAREPDPVAAAAIAELNGADGITVHLREDRRHINDRDVRLLRQTVRTRLNLELSLAAEIVRVACRIKPDQATVVPERREEITTEGGLDAQSQPARLRAAVRRLRRQGIMVSLFIDPDGEQVRAAAAAGAQAVELHTGRYAAARPADRGRQLRSLAAAAAAARQSGLRVFAGHGLDYWNVSELLAAVPVIEEVNIGHAIIARATVTGIAQAVRDMKALLSVPGAGQ